MDSTMNAVLAEKPSPLINAGDESFWRSLNPDLHITAHPFADASLTMGITPEQVERSFARVIKDGYFSLPPIIDAALTDRLARTVKDLVARQIPPAFSFVYDEFWQLFYRLHPVLIALLGEGYKIVPTDIWGWHIGKSGAGWRPHRDMWAKDSVREDKRPRVVNCWIPLTDATPLNSCMYVLPAHLDPNVPDNLTSKENYDLYSFHNIRAVPAQAGSAMGWNMQVLHWGGKSSEWAEEPRISFAIDMHSADCELNALEYEECRKDYTALTFDHTLEMPFAMRLRALAGAIQLYGFPKSNPHLDAFSNQYIGG
jgi:hypothetical protein